MAPFIRLLTLAGVFKALFGAMGFPFGFTTIVVCGAELYTSLCAYMMAAWWEGKVCAHTWVHDVMLGWQCIAYDMVIIYVSFVQLPCKDSIMECF